MGFYLRATIVAAGLSTAPDCNIDRLVHDMYSYAGWQKTCAYYFLLLPNGVANSLVKTRLRYPDLDFTWLDVFKLGNAQLQHPVQVTFTPTG